MGTVSSFVDPLEQLGQAGLEREWWTVPGFRFESPNTYRPGDLRCQPVEAVVFHFTGPGTANRILRWFQMTRREIEEVYARRRLGKPPPPASAHFLVGREDPEGRVPIWQLAPLSHRTWHAGARSSELRIGPAEWTGSGVNSATIGIEILNIGPARLDSQGAIRDSRASLWPGPVACAGGEKWGSHRYWEPYSPAVTRAICELTHRLARRFPRLAANPFERLVGHEDVDPARKTDPGPLFPWSEVRAAAAEAA